MERTLTVTLTIELEVDGIPPPDEDLFNEIGREIVEAMPGVLCLTTQDEYALPIRSIAYEVK